MASFKYTFASGDTLTPARLNDARDVFDIVNADIKSDAAIAGTKIVPDFGTQNVVANGSFAAQASTGDGDCFIIGNDAKLVDISAPDTCALYGLQDATKGSLKLGSGGGTISGASSNIGIGTTAPTQAFHVVGSVLATPATWGASGTAIVYLGDTNNYVSSLWTGPTTLAGFNGLTFLAGSALSERARITEAGNVGIATSTPATRLDVNGDVTITDKIVHSGDTNTAIRFPSNDTVSIETNGSERLRIDSSGNIGIATTTMSQRLNVEGSIHMGPGSALRYITTTSEHLAFVKKSGGPFHFYFRKTDDGTADGANSTDLMVVTDGGDVGIATASPASRLHVAGDLTLSSATTATTATAGAETLPANPEGFLVVSINGTSRKIPYYAT